MEKKSKNNSRNASQQSWHKVFLPFLTNTAAVGNEVILILHFPLWHLPPPPKTAWRCCCGWVSSASQTLSFGLRVGDCSSLCWIPWQPPAHQTSAFMCEHAHTQIIHTCMSAHTHKQTNSTHVTISNVTWYSPKQGVFHSPTVNNLQFCIKTNASTQSTWKGEKKKPFQGSVRNIHVRMQMF